MQQKTAILVLSDPRSGGEEALGRVFNALAAAYDFKQAGEPVTVLFHGAGTRWGKVLSDANHPAHGLFEEVRDVIAGVSDACSTVFGAKEDAKSVGLQLVRGNAVPGTPGMPSLLNLARDGYRIVTF